MADQPLLALEHLTAHYVSQQGTRVVRAVDDISLSLDAGETLGIVGESGFGKSTLALTIMRLLPPAARIVGGRMMFEGENLLDKSDAEMRHVRGKRIAMVLQDPKYSLDPVMSVGQQIAETHRSHLGSSHRDARRAALAMLEAVHIRDPERVYALYPHQVSGGMGQRAMIAMMLIAGPDLLIADEPTSALDVSVQQQVLVIMDDLVRGRGMGLILISHNLHLVSSFCDRVLVMYAGRVVETCIASELGEARHPYTRGLLASLPELGRRRAELPQLQRDPAWAEEDA